MSGRGEKFVMTSLDEVRFGDPPVPPPQAPFAFDPDEPREPSGSEGGGRWTSGGGGAGAAVGRKKRLARKAQEGAFRAAYEARQAYGKALPLLPADTPLPALVREAVRHLATESYRAAAALRPAILSATYRAGTHDRLPPEAVHWLHVAGAYGTDARKLTQKAERLFVSAYRQKRRGGGKGGAAPFAWDESKHPRGQPENAGEFGPGGAAGPGADAPQPPAPESAAKRKARGRMEVALAGLSGPMQDVQREVVDGVLARMPDRAVRRMDRNVSAYAFDEDSRPVAEEFYARSGKKPARGERVYGFYSTRDGTLRTDGGGSMGGGARDILRSEVLAHEAGHAIDGPRFEYSTSRDWSRAWHAELRGGGLSAYAATNWQEGFAEFARALYASPARRAEVERQFPLCTAFFRRKGLL